MPSHIRVSLTTDGDVVLRISVGDGEETTTLAIQLEPAESIEVGEVLVRAGQRSADVRTLIAEVDSIVIDDSGSDDN